MHRVADLGLQRPHSARARAGDFKQYTADNPYPQCGRPEAMFAIERLIDIAARQFGFDRIGLRRRNLISSRAQPYANPAGLGL